MKRTVKHFHRSLRLRVFCLPATYLISPAFVPRIILLIYNFRRDALNFVRKNSPDRSYRTEQQWGGKVYSTGRKDFCMASLTVSLNSRDILELKVPSGRLSLCHHRRSSVSLRSRFSLLPPSPLPPPPPLVTHSISVIEKSTGATLCLAWILVSATSVHFDFHNVLLRRSDAFS